MHGLEHLGTGTIATITGVCSMAATGVLGIFGSGSDDGDLSDVARRLGTEEDPDRIEEKLADLEEAIDVLVADADLERHVRNSPARDASSVEKAEALSRAIEGNQLSVDPASTPGRASNAGVGPNDGTGAVTSAATRIQRDSSPSSPAARQLLDRVASPTRTDPEKVEAILEEAVTALDTKHALERAMAEVGADGLAPGGARRVRDRLDHPDNEATAGVRQLVRAVESHHETAERHETQRETVAAATDSLTEAAADASDLDIGPDSERPDTERLRVLSDAVERGELGFAENGGGRVQSVAQEVRRSKNPESAVAKRLLDRLASSDVGDLRAALDTAVEQLDTTSTTRSIVADLDRESIRGLADDVTSQLEATDGPVADAVAERVESLRGTLDRADESNAVIPYAVRHELRFYEQTLLSHVGDRSNPGESNRGGGEAKRSLDEVASRREDLEDQYVDGRRSHNHSIPLHFLSLVDTLREDAELAADAGDADRALGLCSAAEKTLDHVEQLYTRNEYSVMLRRLRG